MSAAKPHAYPYTPRRVEVLNAEDIGHTIRFYAWDADREIATVTTAEVRQLSANGEEVTIIYGLLAEREHTFQHGELVSLSPPPDYSDVVALRQEFCDYHGITEDLL